MIHFICSVCLFVSLGARPVLAFLQVNLFFFEFYSALMFILSCFCFLLSCKTLLLLLLLLLLHIKEAPVCWYVAESQWLMGQGGYSEEWSCDRLH